MDGGQVLWDKNPARVRKKGRVAVVPRERRKTMKTLSKIIRTGAAAALMLATVTTGA